MVSFTSSRVRPTMLRKVAFASGAFLLGSLLTAGGIFYLAWAASLAGPIDWAGVRSMAAFMAPFGGFGAAVFGWMYA